jgi:hypothetical protein
MKQLFGDIDSEHTHLWHGTRLRARE